jgi:hypothetical protein
MHTLVLCLKFGLRKIHAVKDQSPAASTLQKLLENKNTFQKHFSPKGRTC